MCRQDQCSYTTVHSSSNLAVHRCTVHLVLPSPSYTALSRNMAKDLGSLLGEWQVSFANDVAGTVAPPRPLLQPAEPIPPWRSLQPPLQPPPVPVMQPPLQPPPVPVSGLPLSNPPLSGSQEEWPPSGTGWVDPASEHWETSGSSWEAPTSGNWDQDWSSWEAPTSERWRQDTSGYSCEAPTSGDWVEDTSWSSWESSTSGNCVRGTSSSSWHAPTSNWTDVGKGGRMLEPQRSGINGGRDRKGEPGGRNKDYYKMLYGIKANKGKAAMQRFIDMFGQPPGSGGAKFHDRKSD